MSIVHVEEVSPPHAASEVFLFQYLSNNKPKLAYLSPLPPERSGISDYSAELLPELSQFYDIEVVVEQEEVSDHWITTHCPVRTIRWFREHQGDYDRILYHIGNSPFHLFMFDLLREVPGVVVLHDFFLSDILDYRDRSGLAPGSFGAELYHSHGYQTLHRLFSSAHGLSNVLATYPCNFSILQRATGVILHSRYAVSLAATWYDKRLSEHLALLPLMRSATTNRDRAEARRMLGFGDNDMLVCSFGLPDTHKLSDLLLEAWHASSLADDVHCTLLYVGELLQNDFCKQLQEDIARLGGSIRLTGWVPLEEYRRYLSAADIGVQLRTMSRGESSASALDCMSYGLATIVNANGSMAELPAECVMMLPDKVTILELKNALDTLRADSALRLRLGKNASAFIQSERSPARIAAGYAEALEQFSQSTKRTLPSCSQPQLLLDVSNLVAKDLKTGIQRVVRSIMMEMLKHPPAGLRVEPIFIVKNEQGVFYRYARQFTTSLLGADAAFCARFTNEPVEVHAGDIFLGLDLCYNTRYGAKLFETFKAAGVRSYFVVYDILPLQFPHYFLPETDKHHHEWMSVAAQSDGLLCISRTVADEVKQWYERAQPESDTPCNIGWFRLGADIEQSIPSTGVPEGFETTLQTLALAPAFLMVGTVEPRKGYEQVLKAFELLWMAGIGGYLVIVGNMGWMVEKLAERLRNHKELNRRLFWFERMSDEALQTLYGTANGIIMASEGEGFGLPLIEAARHGCPILARDLPVFREIAGEHATYFNGNSPVHLADMLKLWMESLRNGSAPQSSAIPWISWSESTARMVHLLTDNQNSNWLYRMENQQHNHQQHQLLFDVSALVGNDLKTGIQRVVRSVAMELLEHPPEGFRVDPVVMEKGELGIAYRYATLPGYHTQNSSLSAGESKATHSANELVTVRDGDIFFGLDLCHNVRFGSAYFEEIKRRGCKLFFVVYDLLPLLFPQHFPSGIDNHHREWMAVVAQSDGVLCISQAVANDVKRWFEEVKPSQTMPFRIGWFHLGANIEKSIPTTGVPEGFDQDVQKLSDAPTILMVGTVEPRKGYQQALMAFKLLWLAAMKVNFVIVGKEGWMVEQLAKRLAKTKRNGQLFWYQGLSDEALQKLYAAADGVLMASEGEGFGLPLIEAAQHGRPILARDIPVFREVAGNHATYYSGNSPYALAKALFSWINKLQKGSAPQSSGMSWMTWKESSAQIVKLLTDSSNKNWMYQLEPASVSPLQQKRSIAFELPVLKTIAVDITPMLPGGENGGAKVFVLELLRMFAAMKPETTFILLTRESAHKELAFLDCRNMQRLMVLKEKSKPAQPQAQPQPLQGFAGWMKKTTSRWKKSVQKRLKKRHAAQRLLHDLHVDLLFCPFTLPQYAEPEIPVVCTIYDLQYKTYPEFFSPEDVAYRNHVFMEAVRKSTIMTAISEYSRQSAITHGAIDPSRIRTIYPRMAHRIAAKQIAENGIVSRLGLVTKRYLLYTANFWKHKNHERLLTAFGIAANEGLPPDFKLVCTGAPCERQREIIEAAKTMGLGDRVLFPGYLPNNELALLLSNCTAMIFPSLYEGFGLPVIEAMQVGVPVACSNTRSLPEIAADSALLFDPLSPDEIACSMLQLTRDDTLRAKLVSAGFRRADAFADQERMAREYWELFEQAGNNSKHQLRGIWSTWREDEQPFVMPYARLKVSVVTPSFNQGAFIERTLMSVAKQQGVTIEHVVFDGGSTDNTVEILRQFSPSVKWVSEKDNGQAAAVNRGIRATDGDIIGWLNSDDIYYPNALAKVANFFDAHTDIDVVYGQADHIDVHDWPFEAYPTEPWNTQRLLDVCFICQPALFFRRRVAEQHGFLNESLHYCMDYEYWLRLANAGVRFAYLEEKLAGSRLYANNKTLGSRVKVHKEINDMFKKALRQVPKRWLKNYAHATTHDRWGGRATSKTEFSIRYFFAKLRWK